MTDLATQLRALTDSAAEPIGLEEVTSRSAPKGTASPPGAAERRSRSSRRVLVAAMAVFVAGLAGLMWFVADRSDSTAPVGAGTGPLYALPPADAADLRVVYPFGPPFESAGTFTYQDPTLGTVQLSTGLTSTTGFTDAETDMQKVLGLGYDAITTGVEGFGTVVVACFPQTDRSGAPITGATVAARADAVVVATPGQAMIRWYGDGIATTLIQDRSGDAGYCTANEKAPALEQAMRQVRLVPRDEWQTFIEQNRIADPQGPTGEATPTTKSGPASWCDAVEALRSSGTIDASTGAIRTDALPYLRAVLSASPEELAPPIQTVITWLEEGAPTPVPAEVSAAENTTTQDWATRCPAG